MEIFQNNRQSIVACCSSLLINILTSSIGGPIALQAVTSLIGDISGSILTDHYKKLVSEVGQHFKNRHPSALNHDLQKALTEALKKAVTNIGILYFISKNIKWIKMKKNR